jgi:hypothetical protein
LSPVAAVVVAITEVVVALVDYYMVHIQYPLAQVTLSQLAAVARDLVQEDWEPMDQILFLHSELLLVAVAEAVIVKMQARQPVGLAQVEHPEPVVLRVL